MPVTRSSSRKHPRSPTPAADSDSELESSTTSLSEVLGTSTSSESVQAHLKQVQDGVQSMIRDMEALRKKNAQIQNKLSSMKETSTKKHPKRRKTEDSDSELNDLRLQELAETIKDLKTQNKRQKRRIENLEATQAQEELQDLRKSSEEVSEGAEMDPLARMRKLLRNFSDLMITNTISADMSETCPICFEDLELKKCSSLECQHIICNVCLQSLSRGTNETVKCPECRKQCDSELTKLITMTEQDRWDKLLMIAQAWDAFDRRGGLETSEEEDEENFITDGSGRSEASGKNDETSSQDPGTLTTDAEQSGASTPPHPSATPFHSSPIREKRKRLAQLAEKRANRKQK